MENIDIVCCILSNLKTNKLFNEVYNMQYNRILINDYGNILLVFVQ